MKAKERAAPWEMSFAAHNFIFLLPTSENLCSETGGNLLQAAMRCNQFRGLLKDACKSGKELRNRIKMIYGEAEGFRVAFQTMLSIAFAI